MNGSQTGTPRQPIVPQATSLLPPLTAVRMVWALTGAFAKEEQSKHAALLVEARLKDISERAGKADQKENEYVLGAIACMEASMRSLDTAYKGRELNFQENEKLREVYLQSVRDGTDFGKTAKDYLKSLPGMSIGGAGGITLASLLPPSKPMIWGVTVGLAAVGFLVNALILQYVRRRTQSLYIGQDYDRDLYYAHYISRVNLILESLYNDLDRIHKKVFGQAYPIESGTATEIVAGLLAGLRPAHSRHQNNCTVAKDIGRCRGHSQTIQLVPLVFCQCVFHDDLLAVSP